MEAVGACENVTSENASPSNSPMEEDKLPYMEDKLPYMEDKMPSPPEKTPEEKTEEVVTGVNDTAKRRRKVR